MLADRRGKTAAFQNTLSIHSLLQTACEDYPRLKIGSAAKQVATARLYQYRRHLTNGGRLTTQNSIISVH